MATAKKPAAKKPAAKKPAAKPATTAVAQRAQVQLPAEVQEQMAADIAAFQQRMSAPTGNRISVTQDKKFRNAAGALRTAWDEHSARLYRGAPVPAELLRRSIPEGALSPASPRASRR